MTKRARDTGESVADAVRCVCMREPTQEQHANFPAALTPLDTQVFHLRQQLPSTVVLLVVCGYKVKLYGRDSRVASRRFGIVCVPTSPFESSSFPVVRLAHYLTRLTEMGYHVALADQVETAAIRASGTKSGAKVFERRITAMYSRATTSSATFEALYQSSASGPRAAASSSRMDEGDAVDDADENVSTIDTEPTLVAESVVGANSPAFRRMQEASLRWVLAVTVSQSSEWSVSLTSFLSLVHSAPHPLLSTESALGCLKDVFVKCDPCEIICDRGSAAQVMAMLEQLGELPVNQGPSVEGVEDVCSRTCICDFQQKEIEQLCAEYAERFRSSNTLSMMRKVPLAEIMAGHDLRSMHLPASACNALGLFRRRGDSSRMMSLLELLDRCTTKVGSRTLRSWVSAPLGDCSAIRDRQAAVVMFAQDHNEIRAVVNSVVDAVRGYLSDPEATLSRFATGVATVAEVVALVKVLTRLQGATKVSHLATASSPAGDVAPLVASLMRDAHGGPHVSSLLECIMQRVNLGAHGPSAVFENVSEMPSSIAAIKVEMDQATAALEEELVSVRAVLQAPQLQYSTISGMEYLIDVTQKKLPRGVSIPQDWTVVSRTQSNTRYQPAAVVDATTALFAARDKIQIAAEQEWRALQLSVASEHAAGMDAARTMLRAAGALDSLCSLSTLAKQPGYTMPTVMDRSVDVDAANVNGVHIISGRHPMLDIALGGGAVAANIVMPQNGTWVLTGPNMGGKSALLRTVGLFAVMAQVGAPVPAVSCTMSLFDAVYCRMGSEDAILENRSTFLNEMLETGDILRSPLLHRALVLIDELGQGTSSFDGLAVATATLHHLIRSGATTMFVTHHTVICDEFSCKSDDERNPRVVCKYMSFEYQKRHSSGDEDKRRDVKFLHIPVDGVSPSSFGIRVASMANLPSSVIDVAQERSATAEVQQRQRVNLHALACFCGLVRPAGHCTRDVPTS